MLIKKTCPFCQGSGVVTVETASFFGLFKREIPTHCNNCQGRGIIYETPVCRVCNGQGLVGNEREICRACNGNGHADTFAFIPRRMLKPGTIFNRRCDACSESEFEVVSQIEQYKLIKSWESEEELRQVELQDRVKVRCTACNHAYYIPLQAEWNDELTPEMITTLEEAGIAARFLYQAEQAKPTAPPGGPPA